MNVLSLFDGMSCGRIALERAVIPVTNYFASEIDKYAIQISKKNYPDIKHLGDVTQVKVDYHVDLLIGGSPCQGFSFAGKQLNFEDPRSALFFEYVRILGECRKINPDIKFLLENVNMKKEYQDIISELLGVQPIRINSSLVSAQMRDRLYWTNIRGVEQPIDEEIYLNDILEDAHSERLKSFCIDANYWKGASVEQYKLKSRRQLVMVGHAENINGHDIIKRVYSPEGKSPTLTAVCGGNQEPKVDIGNYKWRKLHPIECERLQTVPDNYTEGVSNTQRYRMLGNGWTVDVIAHILSYLPG